MTNMSKKRFAKNMKRKKLKQTRNSRPALWSVSTPKHNLLSIGGKVRLYHYTPIENIGSIMTYGLIKGDVIADSSRINNWNAPNLTSENRFHNPGNRTHDEMEIGSLRLEIYFDENDKNIVPFGWFDRTYCGKISTQIIAECNDAGNQNGDIDNQYLYKGPIFPQMIKKVSVWNGETGYWDRLSQNEILERTNTQSKPTLSFMGRNKPYFDWGRMIYWTRNDWTGQIREFYAKTGDREVMKPLYELTDYINNNLKGRKLREYRLRMVKEMCKYARGGGNPQDAFEFAIGVYNNIAKKLLDENG